MKSLLLFSLLIICIASELSNIQDKRGDADDLMEVIIKGKLFNHLGDAITSIGGKVLTLGDILEYCREEVVSSLIGEVRIYSRSTVSDNRGITLVQDGQYRLGVSRSTMGYYYPPQLSLKYSW